MGPWFMSTIGWLSFRGPCTWGAWAQDKEIRVPWRDRRREENPRELLGICVHNAESRLRAVGTLRFLKPLQHATGCSFFSRCIKHRAAMGRKFITKRKNKSLWREEGWRAWLGPLLPSACLRDPWGWSPTSCSHTQHSGSSRLLAVPFLIPWSPEHRPSPSAGLPSYTPQVSSRLLSQWPRIF